ncbi:MAG: hypothetical protein Q4P71_09045 [Actinomycetaceae bacterium]|nr:hypothetical protein [Actinomycetaceae bacterium]
MSVLTVFSVLAVGWSLIAIEARSDFLNDSLGIKDLDTSDSSKVEIASILQFVQPRDEGVKVLIAEPLVEGVSAPFGLDAWPQPGHFWLSPALKDDLELLEARFGDFDGFLASQSLPSANELLVFYRPLPDQFTVLDSSVTDGSEQGPFLSPGCYRCDSGVTPNFFLDDRVSIWSLPFLIAFTAIVPALVLLFMVSRKTLDHYRQFAMEMEAQGVSPQRLGTLLLRSFIPGWAAGSVAGMVGMCLLFLTDVKVPFASYVLRAIDARRHPLILISTYLAGVILALIWISISIRLSQNFGKNSRLFNRATTIVDYILAVAGVAIPIGCSIQYTRQSYLAVYAEVSDDGFLWMWVGLLAAIVLSPFVARVALKVSGSALNGAGRSVGSAIFVVVGRYLGYSRSSERIAQAMMSLILLTAVTITYALIGSVPATQAQELINRIDGRFVRVALPATTQQDQIDAFQKAVSPLRVVILDEGIDLDADGSFTRYEVLWGEATHLEDWGVSAGNNVVAQTLPHFLGSVLMHQDTDIEVFNERPNGHDLEYMNTSLVVYSPGFDRVPRGEIIDIATDNFGVLVNVYVGGEEWVAGANALASQFRWLYIFTAIAALLLTVAVYVANESEADSFSEELRAICELNEARGAFLKIYALKNTAIAVVGIGISLAIAWLFTFGKTTQLSAVGGISTVLTTLGIAFAFIFGALTVTKILDMRRMWAQPRERKKIDLTI